jgi:transcriptional repressor NrdR
MEQKEIPSRAIGEIVMDKMKNLDPVAYVRFASVYREFKDVNTFMDELKSVLRKEADGTITDATDKSTPLLKEQ